MAKMPVGQILRQRAEEDPRRPMITFEDRTVTWAAFDRQTNRLARLYSELGVGLDDMVTIALPNGIEFYEAAFAAWKLGAIPQPVSARLPHAELKAIIDLADPALVVGGPDDMGYDRAHLQSGFGVSPDVSDEALPDKTARHWKAPTSGGSTGRPKLIVAGDSAEFDPDATLMEMRSGQTHLVTGPLYHNAPFSLSMLGLMFGQHIVVMKRFDALKTLELIEKYQVNWLNLVPTMMLRIWRLDPDARNRFDLSSIEALWHMAAPCPVWLKEEWINWIGPEKIWELYGGTEAQGTTTIRGDEWLKHKGSVGKPLDVFVMKILNEDGEEMPVGEVGEIFMAPKAGAGTTYHYVGAEAKATSDGLESLGDLGWFDEDGYLYIADRRTDMILSGGANIYPAEVESVLDSHPHMRSSAVIGLPDEDLGNRVHAIVEATDPLTMEALLSYVEERLVRYKVPRSVEFVTEPLRDDAGKVRRSALRQDRLKPT